MNVGSTKELARESPVAGDRASSSAQTTTTGLRKQMFRRWQWLVLFAFFGWIVAGHVISLGYMKYANVDEAYAASIGERLLEGYKLYDGAVSQRGPLMYYSFEVFAKVFGWDNVLAMRIAALAFSLAHFVLVVWTARKLVSRTAAVVAGLVVAYGLTLGFRPDEGIALHGEVLLVPLLVSGTAFGALAMRHPAASSLRTRSLAIAGFLIGAAVCVKPTTLVHPAPLILWLLFAHTRGETDLRGWLRESLVYLGSVASLPIVFALHALAQGTLKQLIYYCYVYNVTIHTHPMGPGHTWHHPLYGEIAEGPLFAIGAAGVLALMATRWIRRIRLVGRSHSRADFLAGFDLRDYFELHFALAFLLAAWLPQEFQHYFIVPFPFLALVAACHVHQLRRSMKRREKVTKGLVLGITVLGTYASVALAYVREKDDGRVIHDAVLEKTAEYLEKQTTPNDKIFVWGFSPWLYTYSHRRPAGRFVFTTYPIGFVPWFWQAIDRERDHVVPGTMDQLLGDLDREKPAYVVDAGSVMMGRPMRAYAPSLLWLRKNYCFDARFGSYDLYKRRPASGLCPFGDVFPKQPQTVDFWGNPLLVFTTMDLDFPVARRLPPGNPKNPRRFDFTTDVCIDPTEKWRPFVPDHLTCNLDESEIYDNPVLMLEEPKAEEGLP